MALPIAGRPKTVAEIHEYDDDRINTMRQFYNLIRSLTYSERSALANGLHLSLATVQAWYYSRRGTNYDTMLKVIEWDLNGRPTYKQHQELSLFDL